jgi:polyadenylate-binding protein
MDHPNTFQTSSNENTHKMIYVADLPRSTTYMDLSDYFEKSVGPCQICIRRPLFRSFYFAFVMFETIDHARKAAAEHKFPVIKEGKMSRVLPYNTNAIRGDHGKDIQSSSVFVKGFESTKWTHADLYSKFCEFGTIISCKVSIDEEHNFLGFGYIQFSKLEEAQMAIKKMDDFDLSASGGEGRLTVSEYQQKKTIGSKKPFNNVYVKGFVDFPEFGEDDLKQLFSQFGEVLNAAVMRDADGTSKGFGFVCFADPQGAEEAVRFANKPPEGEGEEAASKEELSVKGVKVTSLYVKEAKKKKDRERELRHQNFNFKKSIMLFTLFIKNFPLGTTEQDLRQYFANAFDG